MKFKIIMEQLKFLSINVRGLNNPMKNNIKLKYLFGLNMDILIIQETKLAKNSNFIWNLFQKDYLIFENRANASVMGLAILIKKTSVLNCNCVPKIISNRMLMVKIQNIESRSKLYILNVHVPIIMSNRTSFFKSLSKEIGQFMNIIIAGDMNINSKYKQDLFVKFLSENSLIDLAYSLYSYNLNTRFDKKSQNPLDRIVLSGKFNGSFTLKRLIMPFSDHMILLFTWKYNDLKIKNEFKKMIPNINSLINNNVKKDIIAIIEKFTVKFSKLNDLWLWMCIKQKIYDILVNLTKNKNNRENAKKNVVSRSI